MTEKYLVIQTAFIGDAILTLPMIQKLKENYANSEIDVVSNPTTAQIFSSSPAVKSVFILSKKKEQKSILNTIKFALKLRKNNYTKIIAPHRSFRTSLIVLFASGQESIGFSNSSLGFVYTRKVKYCKECHEVERNLHLISAETSNNKWKIFPEIFADTVGIDKIKSIFKLFKGQKIVAFAPGSVWQTKRYPKEYFVEIINRLSAKGIQCVLIGSESDKILCDEIVALSKSNAVSFAGKFSIAESVEFLRNCNLLVSNDSGPTHIAMAANIACITIFCSTVPQFGFSPYNKTSIVLSYDNLECKPCGIHGHKVCPISSFDCGYKLLPEKVLRSIQSIIDK